MTVFTDAATTATTSSVLTVESSDYIDSATISTVTSLTSVEVDDFVDASTVAIVTSLPTGEYSYTHPTGSWGSFDTDDGVI